MRTAPRPGGPFREALAMRDSGWRVGRWKISLTAKPGVSWDFPSKYGSHAKNLPSQRATGRDVFRDLQIVWSDAQIEIRTSKLGWQPNTFVPSEGTISLSPARHTRF